MMSFLLNLVPMASENTALATLGIVLVPAIWIRLIARYLVGSVKSVRIR